MTQNSTEEYGPGYATSLCAFPNRWPAWRFTTSGGALWFPLPTQPGSYCGWRKSCTTLYTSGPRIYGSQGAQVLQCKMVVWVIFWGPRVQVFREAIAATAGTNRVAGRVMLLVHVARSIMLDKAGCLCNMYRFRPAKKQGLLCDPCPKLTHGPPSFVAPWIHVLSLQ